MTFNCDDVIQLLTDYVDGDLAPGECESLEHHFKACPHCDQFLRSFKQTVLLTGKIRCEDIPPECSQKLHAFLAERLKSFENPAEPER